MLRRGRDRVEEKKEQEIPYGEREEERSRSINIHIASSLSASIFQGGGEGGRGASSRYPRALGSGISGGSPRWALNIHQFPADICVTSALQPARRVSAIGNANTLLLFASFPLFFVLLRISPLPLYSMSLFLSLLLLLLPPRMIISSTARSRFPPLSYYARLNAGKLWSRSEV